MENIRVKIYKKGNLEWEGEILYDPDTRMVQEDTLPAPSKLYGKHDVEINLNGMEKRDLFSSTRRLSSAILREAFCGWLSLLINRKEEAITS